MSSSSTSTSRHSITKLSNLPDPDIFALDNMGGVADPDPEACDPEQLNHGVVMVAFGQEDAHQIVKHYESAQLTLPLI